MLAGKEHRDQVSGDLLVGQRPRVSELGVDEALHHVGFRLAGLAALRNHLGENRSQLLPGPDKP